MKSIYFFITALLAVAQMSAQTPDTVTVIEQPQQVIITETPTGTIVKVKGMKDNDEYNYTYQMEHAANDSIHTLISRSRKTKRKTITGASRVRESTLVADSKLLMTS